MPHRHQKPGARIFVRSTSFGYNRKNFFAKRRMRAGRCGLGHTSPTLGVGGNLLCRIVQFGLLGVARASRVLVSASRRNNLFLTQRSRGVVVRKKSPRSRDALASTQDGCATRSHSLHCSSSRRLFASRRKPHRLLHPAKRKLSKLLFRPRVLIFRSINRRRT